jgi:hypothetical protein
MDSRGRTMSYETVEEFLARGGKIDKVENPTTIKQKPLGSVTKKQTSLMTLAEGELYFAEKGKRTKKVKLTDYSNINFDLIPEHLRKIINPAPQQEVSKDKGETENEAD